MYPTLREEDKPLECTQLPGDTISVPSGWWHCVLNIDDSVAVTQNYVNSTNLELVCLDMAPGFYHRSIARAGHLAMQERQEKVAKPDKNNQELDAVSAAAQAAQESLYLDVDNLAKHTEKQSNHFISNTSKGGYLDRRELRDWLRRLWKLRPDLHTRLWKVRLFEKSLYCVCEFVLLVTTPIVSQILSLMVMLLAPLERP